MDQFFHCTSKKLLLLKTWTKYLSKLTYITLFHRFTDLSCEYKNVVQTCPELTLFLPTIPAPSHHTVDNDEPTTGHCLLDELGRGVEIPVKVPHHQP